MAAVLPDMSAIDAAVIAKLDGDSILSALVPSGVFWDLAPQGTTLYVSVSLAEFVNEGVLGGADGIDRVGYTVKVVSRTTGGTTVRDAAARIHDLLHLQSLDLDPSTGYEQMICKRVQRIRHTEPDAADPAAHWQHRGGVYDVMVSL